MMNIQQIERLEELLRQLDSDGAVRSLTAGAGGLSAALSELLALRQAIAVIDEDPYDPLAIIDLLAGLGVREHGIGGATPLIYTVGDPTIYEPLFANPLPPRKLGRRYNYPGGSVWLTREEAQACADESGLGFKAYGVRADWQTQTAPCKNGKFHDLLADSLLVKLPEA